MEKEKKNISGAIATLILGIPLLLLSILFCYLSIVETGPGILLYWAILFTFDYFYLMFAIYLGTFVFIGIKRKFNTVLLIIDIIVLLLSLGFVIAANVITFHF